jgi:hypothetical protein
MKRTVLSERLVRSKAALIEKTLNEVSEAAGFAAGSGYLYRLFGRDNIQLNTVNRIARVLGCGACEILEEVEEEE